ncbi:hypothetical protein HY798_03015 [Candidatus Falkowbacteria bacterium]|nr:hypothetical protein [Candidatus Falkowbacteria bacterium]
MEMERKKDKKIGFIGQGWVGKNYADDFEKRGFEVVRYSIEEKYIGNKDKIKECDIVFIAVPTPSTPDNGFDDSVLKGTLHLVGDGKTAVIKSTISLGTTEAVQKENSRIYVLHSPEFLTRSTAAYDAANPARNIIGIPQDTDIFRAKAKEVMEVLPRAPYEIICLAGEAEFIKYGGNCFFYFKNIFMNLFYDLIKKSGRNWDVIRKAIAADPRIGETHTHPFHQGGRGAGGDCLIKDFAAFLEMYKKIAVDNLGVKILESIRDKNIHLLASSGKDIELLRGAHGEELIEEILKKIKN